jgi:hypothetical protein
MESGALFGQWDGEGAMVYFVGDASNGNIRIYSGGANATVNLGTPQNTGGRHHWVLTHDGTTQRLWVDGVNVVSQTVGQQAGSGGGNLEFPRDAVWAGVMGDIAIWDTALDSTAVNAHFDQGNL